MNAQFTKCNLVCRSATPFTSASGREAVKMVMEATGGELAGQSFRYWYTDSHPFTAKIMERHNLPSRDSDLSVLVGREFVAAIKIGEKYPTVVLSP